MDPRARLLFQKLMVGGVDPAKIAEIGMAREGGASFNPFLDLEGLPGPQAELLRRRYCPRTSWASRPLGPSTISNSTFWPSLTRCRILSASVWPDDAWTAGVCSCAARVDLPEPSDADERAAMKASDATAVVM